MIILIIIAVLITQFSITIYDVATNHGMPFSINQSETIILKDDHAPLVERVMYGPIEDQVRLCLIERYRVMDVNEEVSGGVWRS